MKRQQQQEQEHDRRLLQTPADPSGPQGADGSKTGNSRDAIHRVSNKTKGKNSTLHTFINTFNRFFAHARNKAGGTDLKW